MLPRATLPHARAVRRVAAYARAALRAIFPEWLGFTLSAALVFAGYAFVAMSCKGAPAPVAQAATVAIDCAKTEAQAVAGNTSVLQVAADVQSAIAAAQGGLSQLEAAIEPLITKYGEAIVACAIERELAPAPSGSATAQATPTQAQSLAERLIVMHQWKFAPAASP